MRGGDMAELDHGDGMRGVSEQLLGLGARDGASDGVLVQRGVHGAGRGHVHGVRSRGVQGSERVVGVRDMWGGDVHTVWAECGDGLHGMPRELLVIGSGERRTNVVYMQRGVHGTGRGGVHSVRSRDIQGSDGVVGVRPVCGGDMAERECGDGMRGMSRELLVVAAGK